MTAATVISLFLGRRIGLRKRLLIKESFNILTHEGLVLFTKRVLWTTIIIEGIGAALLTVRFLYDFSYPKAIYLGVFHSVTAFNNAGFSLFSDNLAGYKGDLTVNVVIMGLIIYGGRPLNAI